ncbi:putative BET1-like protein [Helianthus annuus]|nr:putative BET1-like protein [Helianthus annuus]KAJ0506519.1 putative BET1-like protein [Helianthus annuus]KAJ0676198.1 putative BET1-like protein [Helianthus annuus]KAJ0679424.1 putative BET1-like protein [Helianthus annuus]
MSYRRDNRASRTALFDNLDGIEEGGLRASSSYSRDIDEQENEKSLNSLQDRIVFLKRVSYFLNFSVAKCALVVILTCLFR